jgi:hypothetical protein
VRFRFEKWYKSGKKGLIPHVIGNALILIKVKYKTKDITEISVSCTSRNYLEKLCDITIQAFGSHNAKLNIQKVEERMRKL